MDRVRVITNLRDTVDEVIGSLDDAHRIMLLRLLGVTEDYGFFIVSCDNLSEHIQSALDHIDRVFTPDFCEQQFQEEYDRT